MKKLLICFLILISSHSEAQDFFSKANGTWEGEGNLFGQPAKFTMKWDSVFGGSFVRLNFSNQIQGTDKPFEAIGFYQKSSLSGHWLDSRGIMQNLAFTLEDSILIVIWTSQTEKGKTVYSMLETDKIQVEDFVFKNNEWKPFGKAIYTRK